MSLTYRGDPAFLDNLLESSLLISEPVARMCGFEAGKRKLREHDTATCISF